MSELPSLVRVKRKRGADPTPDLFLEERSTKRSQIWQFRLQALHPSENKPALERHNQEQSEKTASDADDERARRREFRLAIDKKNLRNIANKRRKAQVDGKDIPTFVEATARKRKFEGEDVASEPEPMDHDVKPPPALKRPIANAKERQWRAETWKQSTASTAPTLQADPPPKGLVDALEQFALEEAARDEVREKPKVTSIPKKPVQRYKDRFPKEYAAQVAARSKTQTPGLSQDNVDVDMDTSDEEDYVYDTYVRTKEPVMLPSMDKDDAAHDKIGYLVITEQDQPFWETYFEDEDSEKEFESDDEDENGETWPSA